MNHPVYTLSICHPDKEAIEALPKLLSPQEALQFFDEYPWEKQLDLLEGMDQKEVFYSPSVGMTNTKHRISLEMTADRMEGKLSFSLWYNRPVKQKILFGLLGEKKVKKLTDKWGFSPQEARANLEAFLAEDYEKVEKAMNKQNA